MMQTMNQIERMFHDEIRDKKRTASGVHHKTGKNGYVGTMRFPSDIMSRKDKMRYRRAGKVLTTNIFDNILTIDEFNQLETHEKKNRMQYWRTNFTNKEIQEKMGIANSPYYKIIQELDLPKAPRTERDKPNRKATTKVQEKSVAIKSVPEVEEEKEVVQEVIVNGLNVIFNGTYGAEKIEKQLTKFMLLLEGEEDEFYIEFRLMQKQPKK